MNRPSIVHFWIALVSLCAASSIAAAGAMNVLAEEPCTVNGKAVSQAYASAHPDECDPGTAPTAPGDGGDGGVVVSGDTGGGAAPPDAGGGDTPADDGGASAGGDTSTGDDGTGTGDDGAAGDGAGDDGAGDTSGGDTDGDSEGGAGDGGDGSSGDDTGDETTDDGDTDAGPTEPDPVDPTPTKPKPNKPKPTKPTGNTKHTRNQAAHTPKVYEVTFRDARTFRQNFRPAGRIPELPELDKDAAATLRSVARESKVRWSLLAAVAWLDSHWGDPAAGSFVGRHLSDARWSTYATDGDGDGAVRRTNVADQLATTATFLSSGKRSKTLVRYFGGHKARARRALFLNAYFNALGTDALVDGLADEDVRDKLAKRVLKDKRIDLYSGGALDVEDGLIDPRILVLLEFVANRHGKVTVSSLVSGHNVFTASGNVSLHSFGQAVDISAVNKKPIFGNQRGKKSITVKVLKDVLRMPKSMQPAELISLWNLGGASFALSDHDDHIHVGYKTLSLASEDAPSF